MLKKTGIIFFVLLFGVNVQAKEEPEQLYARSAVLMDADSGRILFEKNGFEQRAMASTTKIMTCILALEKGNPEEVVTASANAARQPKVHLGVREGEKYLLGDLLYSMMLESHNDSAVMIAEHIGGTVEGFAGMMNRKAKEIGCKNTYFITPNGLDATDERGRHSTTAADLARIMSYCIEESEEKEAFIQVSGKKEYVFSELKNKRTFSCNNHNAFLAMMEGAISGKTGFTGDAGYCYVGALRRDDRTFVVALLGCGWPNNKTYKWADTKKLMRYGLDNYTYHPIRKIEAPAPIRVTKGVSSDKTSVNEVTVPVAIQDGNKFSGQILLKEGEEIRVETRIKKELQAPVKRGEKVGEIGLYLGGERLYHCDVVTAEQVERISLKWCVLKILAMYAVC